MKTEDEITKLIEDKETELKNLIDSHNNMVAQFNQTVAQNQAKANELQGEIKAYKDLVKPPF